jgi:hypothetical protein
MTNKKWKSTNSTNTCPSCEALHSQVHTQDQWDAYGITPKHDRLYCRSGCNCEMQDTDEAESGDLSTVPLRAADRDSYGSADRRVRRSLSTGDTPEPPKEKTMKKRPMPVLRSLPIHEKLELPSRAELLPKIESGEIDHLDFNARTYRHDMRNRNPYIFQDKDLESFAASFEGQPFLRNHDTLDIDARDGTIIESQLEGSAFRQTIRLTTRRGMTDFIEGKIDRFSIGWFYDDILCSICNQSWFSCSHYPGMTYKVGEAKEDKVCQLIFINPSGKETSAVNTPAVEGTGIDQLAIKELQEFKLEVIGDGVRRDPRAPRVSKSQPRKGVNKMDPEDTNNESATQRAALDQIEANKKAAADLLGESERMNALEAQLAESNAVLVAQCEFLLNSGLAASRLPEVVQKRIRKTFEGKAFRAPELQTAITEAREELAALTEGANIQGPGRITGMSDSRDQFRLAVEDLLGLEREANERTVRVHTLSGIREAYLLATGDQSFMGGYYPEFANVTANFPGIVANIMNKMLIKAWEDFRQHYGWWEKIVTVEHFTNLNQVAWIKTGTIASLPTVLERGEYTELPIGDNKETTDWTKYGGYVPLTIEAVLRDDVRAFRRMPREVALGGIRNISEQVAAIFTSGSAAGPTLADGGALFNATAVTTAGGHANLLTTALGTDYTAWNAVAAAVFNQPMLVKNAAGYYGTGKKMALDPSFALLPRALKNQAEALFIPRWEAQAQNVSAVSPSWGGRVEPLTVPEWTDATDWAAAVDPKLVPGVMLGEIFGVKPQIFSASSEIDPAMFANDESRIKVRQFLAVGVADFRPLHKSNVGG